MEPQQAGITYVCSYVRASSSGVIVCYNCFLVYKYMRLLFITFSSVLTYKHFNARFLGYPENLELFLEQETTAF